MSFNNKENNKKVLVSSLFLIACIILALLKIFVVLQNNDVISLTLLLVPDILLLIYSILSCKIERKNLFFAIAVSIYVISLIVEMTYWDPVFWSVKCCDNILNIVLGIVLIALSCKGLKDRYVLRCIILAMAIIAVRVEFDSILSDIIMDSWTIDSSLLYIILSFLHNAFYFIALFIITPVKNYKTRVRFEQNKTI